MSLDKKTEVVPEQHPVNAFRKTSSSGCCSGTTTEATDVPECLQFSGMLLACSIHRNAAQQQQQQQQTATACNNSNSSELQSKAKHFKKNFKKIFKKIKNIFHFLWNNVK
jgi:hypothetical protein